MDFGELSHVNVWKAKYLCLCIRFLKEKGNRVGCCFGFVCFVVSKKGVFMFFPTNFAGFLDILYSILVHAEQLMVAIIVRLSLKFFGPASQNDPSKHSVAGPTFWRSKTS